MRKLIERLNQYSFINAVIYASVIMLGIMIIDGAYRLHSLDQQLKEINAYMVFDPDFARTTCLQNVQNAYAMGCVRETYYKETTNEWSLQYCNRHYETERSDFEISVVNQIRRDKGSCL